MPAPFEITFPHFRPAAARRIRVIDDIFMAGGVATAPHSSTNHLLLYLVSGTTILRGWYPKRVSGHAAVGRVWAAVCDVAGLNLQAGTEYDLVLARRPQPHGGSFTHATTLERVTFFPLAAAPAPKGPGPMPKYFASILFPDANTEHSHYAFCPYGAVSAGGEEVPHSNVILKNGTATADTADYGEKAGGRNVWWATFDEVTGNGPYTLDVTSSTGSNPTAAGLTFVN